MELHKSSIHRHLCDADALQSVGWGVLWIQFIGIVPHKEIAEEGRRSLASNTSLDGHDAL